MISGFAGIDCADDARRALLEKDPTLCGIDYLEVATDPLNNQRLLHVHFFPAANVAALLSALSADRFSIDGGERIQDVQVLSAHVVADHIDLRVDRIGDFSEYRLIVSSDRLDPAFAQVGFSFKAGCPSRFDCLPRNDCPTPPLSEPVIDYMAKDYASFRQAMLDYLPTISPRWTERHEADVAIALIELLAYVGDQLSYFQDAVANEAYLDTARQRISVRRHARLIDYQMHDGSSARTFVHFSVAQTGVIPAGTRLLTRLDVPIAGKPLSVQVGKSDAVAATALAQIVFETVDDLLAEPALQEIPIYAWGNQQCCLPVGATTADLVGNNLPLHKGDFLLFEELKGPRPGDPPELKHRQVVRLTNVQAGLIDPLIKDGYGNPIQITRVAWSAEDGLRFPLCLSSIYGGQPVAGPLAVARGNLALADHGNRVAPEVSLVPSATDGLGRRPFHLLVTRGPLSQRLPGPSGNTEPASSLLTVAPQLAAPQVVQIDVIGIPGAGKWQPRPDLLTSGPFARDFVVETDNNGRAELRFGDDVHGLALPGGSQVTVTYRIGCGTPGNIGAEALYHVISPGGFGWPDVYAVRNPLPAWGGVDPQPIEQVKRLAPAAFRAELKRAVTAADYALAAQMHPAVAQAVANFRWTGSWYTVFITASPVSTVKFTPELAAQIEIWVDGFTQAGYDLEVNEPGLAALTVDLDVCVDSDQFPADVERALLSALTSGPLRNSLTGLFRAGRFGIGETLYASQLYAAAMAVDGVSSVVIRRFARLDQPDPDPARPATAANLAMGFIPVGPLEVFRLDNDATFPEAGELRLNMRGGK
jgi:hypothetical protein